MSGSAGEGGGKSRRKKKSEAKKESEAAAATGTEDNPEAAEGATADLVAGASHVSADEEVSVPSVEMAGVFSWDGDDDHPLVEGDAAAT